MLGNGALHKFMYSEKEDKQRNTGKLIIWLVLQQDEKYLKESMQSSAIFDLTYPFQTKMGFY